LDGLRAVAIVIVLVSHFGNKVSHIVWVPKVGEIGVDVFFVISGLLITLLLLREERRTGQISLRAFYLRRALRIFPAYFAFLIGLAVLHNVEGSALRTQSWVAALTYTSSLCSHDIQYDIDHTWSLSVEEHFYLLWPALLCVRPRQLLLGVGFYITVTPLVRVALYKYAGIEVAKFTFTRIDSIAIGCILAFVLASPRLRVMGRAVQARPNLVILTGIVFIAATKAVYDYYRSIPVAHFYAGALSPTVNSLVIAAMVWACISARRGLVHRVLESRPLVFVGCLSYSLYLWQQPFTHPSRNEWPFVWPFNVVGVVVFALISYYFIERPALLLKDRLSRRA
jgi:peptidoglycan/LPS O-acetylase OafA/YrhL